MIQKWQTRELVIAYKISRTSFDPLYFVIFIASTLPFKANFTWEALCVRMHWRICIEWYFNEINPETNGANSPNREAMERVLLF